MAHSNQANPTAPLQRIDTLDILRGFAIFGIFMVNAEIMNCVFLNGDAFAGQWITPIHKIAIKIQQLFFYAKFFPIFSLLFGIGISIQLMNMHRKGTSSAFFFSRMIALSAFGTSHILFLWSGDVVHLYALLGLLTFAFMQLQSRYLIIIAVVLLIFPCYNQMFEGSQNLTGVNPESFLSPYTSDDIRKVIRSGSYMEGMLLRVREYASNVGVLYVFLTPVALVMFLIGLFIGKKGYLKDIPYWTRHVKKPVLIIAIISNTYRIIFLFFIWETDIWEDPIWRETLIYFMQICDTAMALFYVWLIAYICQFSFWNRLLSPLKYAGRMALTNYLMQSLIGLFLFSSIGFSWYETLSPTQTILLAVLVFIFQTLLSKLWLTFFQFGPVEWVWRCISYWKVISMRKME